MGKFTGVIVFLILGVGITVGSVLRSIISARRNSK